MFWQDIFVEHKNECENSLLKKIDSSYLYEDNAAAFKHIDDNLNKQKFTWAQFYLKNNQNEQVLIEFDFVQIFFA